MDNEAFREMLRRQRVEVPVDVLWPRMKKQCADVIGPEAK